MKISTYKDGSRDGQLVVVSRDLSLAHYATGIVGRMQQLLDDWNFLSPQLEELSQTLNHGKARHAFPFDPAMCMPPLPRSHCVALVDPPISRRGRHALEVTIVRGDSLLGACEPLPLSAAAGNADETERTTAELDFCAQLVLITGDLGGGSAADDALASIRLVGLACGWHLADPAGQPRIDPWGSISFAPVAVTPDEFGAAWSNGRIDLDLEVRLGDNRFGSCKTAADAGWPIGEVLAACARYGILHAGAIIGIGMPVVDSGKGELSIGSRRQRELENDGAARTPYLTGREVLGLEVTGADGCSVFGAIAPATVGRR